jgi:alkylation response protein AidB-like acyl-CoA dehydrogenase
MIASVVLAGGLLSRLGSTDQLKAFLEPMVEGRTTLAFAYAERQGRYHPHECATRAARRGAGFAISGEKVWVLNGHAADHVVVVARTSGAQSDAAGLSLFVVDANAPGLTRTRVPTMDGQRCGLLRFENVEVGADHLLGPENAAFAPVEWAIDRGAAAACAEGQGAVQELFERTVAYLKQRVQFGVPIGSFQALQHRAADMYAETELCRSSMILAAIEADDEDEETRKREISTAKLQLGRGGWYVMENAIQLFGGIGVTDEQDEGLFFERLCVLRLQSVFADLAAGGTLERFPIMVSAVTTPSTYDVVPTPSRTRRARRRSRTSPRDRASSRGRGRCGPSPPTSSCRSHGGPG